MPKRDLVPWHWGRKEVPVEGEGEGPFHPLQREVNRLFDDFLRGPWLEPFRGFAHMGRFVPRVDVTEDEREIRVAAELPGMDEKEIEVVVDQDTLMIKGEKKEEHEERTKDYFRSERSYGSFRRVIPLPDEVDREKIEAEFKKGVLTVRMPKVIEARPDRKKIEIKGG